MNSFRVLCSVLVREIGDSAFFWSLVVKKGGSKLCVVLRKQYVVVDFLWIGPVKHFLC